jgi:PEP-CTERM motif
MKTVLKKALIALAVGVALGVAPSVAHANTITVSFVNIVPVGSNFQWNYQISQDANGRITPGAAPGVVTLDSSTEGQVADFFTIYDINGFVSASVPAGWAFQTLLVGSTDEHIANPDSASITNLTVYRTGASTGAGPFTIGGFSFIATSGASVNGFWSAEDTHNGGATDGTTDWSGGRVLVPAPVPEPTTLLLFGSALAGFAIRRRRQA